jgi:hypothetical protein
VCYGQPDVEFAEKLGANLKANGVTCWLYSIGTTLGEKTWGEINRKRREAEKMIVLCSANSLIREGSLKEIEEQLDEAPEKMIAISLDNIWKEPGFRVMRGQRDLKLFRLEQNYVDFIDASTYQASIDKFLKDLERTQQNASS